MAMEILHASKAAFRAVKKHTLGYTRAQSRVLHITDSHAVTGTSFVSLPLRIEVAQLSWDDATCDQITEIFTQRLLDRRRWQRVVKTLIVLQYCLEEGSGKIGVWCQLHRDLIEGLESFEYTFEENKDRGIEVRRWARKVLSTLSHPQYPEMRGYTEETHLARSKTTTRRPSASKLKVSLRRSGALFGLRRSEGSDVSTDTDDLSEPASPVTIRQRVMNAVSDSVSLETAMGDIRDIARRTSCPADFMEILEAILEGLLSNEQDRNWSHVFKALVLLRQCLSNVSEDVAQHFEGNPRAMSLLRGFQDLGDVDLLGESAAVVRFSQQARLTPITVSPSEKQPIVNHENLANVTTVVRTTKLEMEPPVYTVLNPDADSDSPPNQELFSSAHDEKVRLRMRDNTSLYSSSPFPSSPTPRPLPMSPVDWSRLRTAAANQATQSSTLSLPREKQDISRAWAATRSISSSSRPFRPLPIPVATSTPFFREIPPSYSTDDNPLVSVDTELPEYTSPPHSPIAEDEEIEYETEVDADAASNTGTESTNTEVIPEDAAPPSFHAHLDLATIVLFPEIEPFGSETNEDDEEVQPSESWIIPWTEDRISEVLTDEPESIEAGSISPKLSKPSNEASSYANKEELEEIKRGSAMGIRSSASNDFGPSSSTTRTTACRCLNGIIRKSTDGIRAKGGYSDVWKGIITDNSSYNEVVAVKVLRAVKMNGKSNTKPLERIQMRMHREMDIWRALYHPNIVPLRGYAIEDDGTPQLISPWYDNGDVLSYLERHPFADRRKIVRQVAQGLLYLHSRSPPVVHGDLKGGNVLIDRCGEAALCDFGQSKLLQECPSSFATSNNAIGTLRWSSPELLMADVPEKTLASDVWAFAFLALEILTGKIPYYSCSNDAKVLQSIIQGAVPSRADYPEICEGNMFWELLESCWKIKPEERPTMDDVWNRLADDEVFATRELTETPNL